MGECGCGETVPYKILQIDDKVLVVEIYRGCEYCDTGLIVTLHLNTAESAAEWDWEPDTKLEPDDYGHAQVDFPLLGKDDLVEAAKRMNADAMFGGEDGYETLTDWLSDNGLELLQTALRLRLEKLV